MERRMSSRTKARAIWSAAAAVLISAGVCTATASAHTAPIAANCESGLSVVLTDYSADGVNTVRVWIDGAPRATTSFGASTSATYTFGDPTVSHTWRVSVTAWDDPTGANGWTFDTGTLTIPVCAEPATTVAAPTTTAAAAPATLPGTSAPATTAPATTAPAAPATPTTVTVASAVVTAPTGSSGAPASTSVVAQAAPTTVVASSGTLPVTGPTDARALGIALLMFGFGILLIVATRRPDNA
jgi:hypothetical protein